MGKPTGFLETDRQDRSYDAPSDRLKHYREFIVPHNDATLRGQAARCMNCGIPYCHNGCPMARHSCGPGDQFRETRWACP